jgi:hypothetical protein
MYKNETEIRSSRIQPIAYSLQPTAYSRVQLQHIHTPTPTPTPTRTPTRTHIGTNSYRVCGDGGINSSRVWGWTPGWGWGSSTGPWIGSPTPVPVPAPVPAPVPVLIDSPIPLCSPSRPCRKPGTWECSTPPVFLSPRSLPKIEVYCRCWTGRSCPKQTMTQTCPCRREWASRPSSW